MFLENNRFFLVYRAARNCLIVIFWSENFPILFQQNKLQTECLLIV